MRKLLLLVAAVPLLLAPPAVAGTDHHDASADEAESVCPPPEITHEYDVERMAVHVKLAASGCPTREHSMFSVSAFVGRFDDHGPLDSTERSVTCGPFRSASDQGPDEARSEYFCELDLELAHPEMESVNYDIDVGYPGARSDRNRTLILECRSDGETAGCDS